MTEKIYLFSTIKPGQIYKHQYYTDYIYIQKVGRKYFYFKRGGKNCKGIGNIRGWKLLTPQQTLKHKATVI